jgi:hypothetical protein
MNFKMQGVICVLASAILFSDKSAPKTSNPSWFKYVEWPLPQAKSSTLHFRKIEVVSYVIHKELCFGIVSLFVQDVIIVSNQNWTKFLLVVLDLYSLVLFFRHLFFSINSSPANLVYFAENKETVHLQR